MMRIHQGGCLCGAVRYVLKGEPQGNAICHCTHCQKQSGSLFSFNLFYREEDVEEHGATQVFEDSGDSGQPVQRHFCARCGSPVYTKAAAYPGLVLIKCGTLDDVRRAPSPELEIYTMHEPGWLAPFSGANRFARSM
jgi:hypothetical protein